MKRTTRTRRGLRRVLGLSLGSAMIVALVPGAASAQEEPDAIDTSTICGDVESDFDDIDGSAHEYNIRCMADFGLTEGLRGGDDYGPRMDVTRGQMASFIARFIEDYDGEELPEGDDHFDDVDSTYVHSENINKLAEIEVVLGTNASNGESYAPNAAVTRAQMASFIRRALSYLDNGEVEPASAPPAGGDAFPDDDGSVHEPNINAIADVGIVQGFDDGDYRPRALVKRDQMASFVMRAYAWAESENLGEAPALEVAAAGPDGPVTAGDDFDLTFTGDVDDVTGVDVTGDCITDVNDETLTDGALTLTSEDTAAEGDCTLTVVVTFSDASTQTFDTMVEIVAPLEVAATAPATVAAGDDFELTFTGDVADVTGVDVTGDCITDVTDGTLTDGALTITSEETADTGDCTLTVNVTFSDGSTQEFTTTVEIVPFGVAASAPDTPVTAGDDFDVTFTGDVAEVTAVDASGECIVDVTGATLTGGALTLTSESAAVEGDCTLTGVVTFSDGSTQDFTTTVAIVEPLEVAATAPDTPVTPGDSFELTFTGDVAEVTGVDVTGACIVDVTGATLTDGALTLTSEGTAVEGDCTLTLDVTFSDASTQNFDATVAIGSATP